MTRKNYIYIYNVNPALINPKRLFNWEGTIKKYHTITTWRVLPLLNHGLLTRGWHYISENGSNIKTPGDHRLECLCFVLPSGKLT